MITDYNANTWDWHDDEDERAQELHDEALNGFRSFVRGMQDRTQRAVRALYPRLYQGVDAFEIQQTIEEALYWLAIPEEWAEQFADECVEDGWYHGGVHWWIENELELEKLKAEKEPTDDRSIMDG